MHTSLTWKTKDRIDDAKPSKHLIASSRLKILEIWNLILLPPPPCCQRQLQFRLEATFAVEPAFSSEALLINIRERFACLIGGKQRSKLQDYFMYFDWKGQKGITLRFTLRSNLSRFEWTLWSYLLNQRSNVNELVKGHKEREIKG